MAASASPTTANAATRIDRALGCAIVFPTTVSSVRASTGACDSMRWTTSTTLLADADGSCALLTNRTMPVPGRWDRGTKTV
jgi:hypothetical protein